MNLKITSFDISRADELIDILLKVWTYKNKGDEKDRREVTYLYILSALKDSSLTYMITSDDRLVGVIFGSYNNSKNTQYDKEYSNCLKRILNDDVTQQLYAYNSAIETCNNQMRKRNKPFESEVVLLAVSDEYRGLGIGKTLLNHLIKTFKDDGAKSISLFSDKDSNYKFYGHMKFDVIDTNTLKYKLFDKEYSFDSFLYEKNI